MITTKDFKNKLQKEAVNLVENKLTELLNETFVTDEIYFTIEYCQNVYMDEITTELDKRGFTNIHFKYTDDAIIVCFKIN